MNFAIEIRDLTKRYRKAKSYREILLKPFSREETTALRDVSLSVEAGETFALVGPNGAGKTTLVKILSTLVLPTSGEAFVAGYDVERHADRVRTRIGCVVTEERSFYWRLTGKQNLRFFAVLNNIPRANVERKVNELIALMGLESDADKTFKDYSTGMRHRLAVARALLTDPEILFFDEPTKSLDPPTAETVRGMIAGFVSREPKKTVLLATHDLAEAERLAGRIAILDRGIVRACGALSQLRKIVRAKRKFLLKLRKPEDTVAKLLRQLAAQSQPTAGEDAHYECFLVELGESADISSVIRDLVLAGGQVVECIAVEPSLAEIFSCVTKGQT